MGHFAQSVGVAARVVCKHTPLHLAARAVRMPDNLFFCLVGLLVHDHLLLRTSQPFCDRDFPRPVVSEGGGEKVNLKETFFHGLLLK